MNFKNDRASFWEVLCSIIPQANFQDIVVGENGLDNHKKTG